MNKTCCIGGDVSIQFPYLWEFFSSKFKLKSGLCFDKIEDFLNESPDVEYVFLTQNSPSSYLVCHLNKCGYELSSKLTRAARSIALLENNPCNYFPYYGLVFVKSKPFVPKQDAVITWAGGEEFCKLPTVKAFVNSLNSCGFNGDKLVFTHDMSIEIREYFETNDFKVVDFNPNEFEWVLRDRFFAWYQFLTTVNYRYVCLLDCKDIIFQKNPIEFLEQTNKKLYFVGEGKLHSECSWNSNDQNNCQHSSVSKLKFPFDDWEVICGGTILGIADNIKKLIIQIWSTTFMTKSCTDQAVLNLIYQLFYRNDPDSFFADPRTCNLCVTADLPKNPLPVVKDDVFYHSIIDEPYYFYHQYDRIPNTKNILVKKYT